MDLSAEAMRSATDGPFARVAAYTPELRSVLRIMTGLLFLQHGTQKILGFPPTASMPSWLSLSGTAGLIELVGGALFVLGLFTRPVAFVLSGLMACAYFIAHAPQGFFPILNRGELAALYCFAFLYFVAAGPGPWSIDETRRG
jgi:putative oxidoreductase